MFCAKEGTGGNPLGVFLDGAVFPDDERQAVAAELGYSETVFVDDAAEGRIRIFTPGMELPLAGHPLVGTAWLLRREGSPTDTLRPPAGEVGVRYEDELTWVSGRPEWAPPFDFVEVGSPDEVDAMTGPPEGMGWVGVWAWADRDRGVIRERVFVEEAGIPEDEATGSAAMLLVDQLRREVEIRQGRGSAIYARPLADGLVEIGGRVELDWSGEWTPGDGPPV
ncbi:MAG TPA: PhzF family phenazine biosynthesis protein [Solirubrobacterales bacterium]|nr:PhzF family phenazine biosynthesis protein [Solirubrobacterales bacterium]